MRRPLLYGAAGMILEIILYFHCGRWIALAGVVSGTGVLLLAHRRRSLQKQIPFQKAGLFLLCCVCGWTAMYVSDLRYMQAVSYVGNPHQVSGTIVQSSYYKEEEASYLQLCVMVEEVSGERLHPPFRILIKENMTALDAGAWLPGDRITASGVFELPSARRNPNCFDYRLYLRSTGVSATFYQEILYLETKDDEKTLHGYLEKKKRIFMQMVSSAADEETAAMLQGILFGEKQNLEEGVLEAFQKNGTAHLLAVSGLHVGILYGFLCFLWRWKKGWIFFCVIACLSICYAMLADFSPSVVRAVVMIDLHTFALITNRRYDLRSAAFAVILISLTRNPMQLFHTGFQMSFLAVLSLSVVLPFVQRFFTGALAGSVAVQTGLLPYTIYHFNYVSLSSVLINVPMIALAGILVPMGIGTMLLQFAGIPGAAAGCKLLSGLCAVLQYLNQMTCIDGVTVFAVTSPSRTLMALYYLGLLFLLSEDGRLLFLRKQWKRIISCILTVVVAALFFGGITRSGFEQARITFVDVGQGDCMHVKTAEGYQLMIDGGGSLRYNIGKKTLKPYLLKNGIRFIDAAFVTHLHTDHYKGIAELCREGMVRRLVLYEGNRVREEEILRETGLKAEQVQYLHQGQTVKFGSDTEIQVLWPERKDSAAYEKLKEAETDENQISLILKVTTGGVSFLVTGDIDAACEKQLAKRYERELQVDILKAAHHGSKYSSSEVFLEQSSPCSIVFQVGKNNYGHPAQEVLDACKTRGITVFRNDEQGAVGIWNRNGVLKVQTVQGKGKSRNTVQ